jgi:eukaryotic-like serine/threonine-protein kinase
VLGTLSDMYVQLGLEQEAAALQLERVDAIKRAYGAGDPRVASALSRYAEALANTPDRSRIAFVLGEAKKILDEAHDDSSIMRAGVLVDYASFYRYSSPQNSRRYADEDVALLEKYHPDDDTLLLALQFAARARAALGQYPTAVEWYQRDLAAIATQVGQGTAWDIAPLAQLAGAQAELLRFGEAERDFRASLALSGRLNGDAHNETLQTQIRLAAFLEATARHAEGRKLMERAWNLFNDDPSKKDNSVASVMYGLYGQSLMDAGELQAAQPLIAAEIEKVRGLYPESTLLSQALLRQASLRIELGQYDAAEEELQSALAGWRHVGGPEAEAALENPYLLALARIAVARGQTTVAEHWLDQTHRASYAASLPTETDGVRKQVLLAAAQLSDGRNAAAMASAKSALEIVQSSPVRGFLPRLEADSAWTLAVAERRNGLLDDARSHLERTLELLRANDDAQSLSIARAELTLAACLSDLGDRQAARMLLGQADRAVASHRELSAEALRVLRTLSR